MHKTFDSNFVPNILKFRPINSSINSYNYNLAKYLSNMVTPLIPSKHSCKDTFTFINEIKQFDKNKYFMVSYDVTSLYTNIPLEEAIQIAVKQIFKNDKNIKISKEEMTELFHFATSKTHFQFNGSLYDQIDGISMGSPLAPALANLFMGFHEEKWLKSRVGRKVKFYKRYVDDIFCFVENENMADEFLIYLNKQHKNIKFTLEKEKDNVIPFLDIKIENMEQGIKTSIYKKKTDTGLLTNFTSFVCFKYKICLIKTLIDRIFKINNTRDGFHEDIKKMDEILQKNDFPSKLIAPNINKALKKKFDQKIDEKRTTEENIQYFKLPYIGSFSKISEQKLKSIIANIANQVQYLR